MNMRSLKLNIVQKLGSLRIFQNLVSQAIKVYEANSVLERDEESINEQEGSKPASHDHDFASYPCNADGRRGHVRLPDYRH